MRQPQSSVRSHAAIVVDTSVIINLNATAHATEIIRAYGVTLCASDVVRDELILDRINGRNDGELAQRLVQEELLEFLAFDEEAEQLFESLVSGPAEMTLDDGEAATLAVAVSLNRTAVIDERKAIKISGERFPGLELMATADILRSDEVFAALGSEGIADALFRGLKGARMAVPERLHDWVVELLGERIVECRSLPAALRQVRK